MILLGIEIQKIESQPSSPAEADRREPGISGGRDLRCNPCLQFVCSFPASTGDRELTSWENFEAVPGESIFERANQLNIRFNRSSDRIPAVGSECHPDAKSACSSRAGDSPPQRMDHGMTRNIRAGTESEDPALEVSMASQQ